jgi:PD-(D/E)XK endonuclease
VLTTDEKGSIAELAIASAAAKLHVGVFKPLTDGERYDLIFDLRPSLVRVQCKWATRNGDVVGVRAYSCRRTAEGLVRRGYSADEIDAIAAYCLELDTCYFIPFGVIGNQRVIQLRLRPTRNNQRRRIRWAEEFDFAATLRPRLGAIAQLGERLRGTQEVAGSSPAGSIFS